MAIIAASVLNADHSRLEHEVIRVADAGVDAFTLDIMDGRFAPRVTFDDDVVARVRNLVDLPIEVHLMIDQPEKSALRYCDAGADLVLFHIEATSRPGAVIDVVREQGRSVGVAIKDKTPVAAISDEVLEQVDLVCLLAVPIGYGGQTIASDTVSRLKKVRERAGRLGKEIALEVDGGIKPHNAGIYYEAGADMLAVGTGIYHADDATEAIRLLHRNSHRGSDSISLNRLATFLSRPSLHKQ